jgi:hypothetical protein
MKYSWIPRDLYILIWPDLYTINLSCYNVMFLQSYLFQCKYCTLTCGFPSPSFTLVGMKRGNNELGLVPSRRGNPACGISPCYEIHAAELLSSATSSPLVTSLYSAFEYILVDSFHKWYRYCVRRNPRLPPARFTSHGGSCAIGGVNKQYR